MHTPVQRRAVRDRPHPFKTSSVTCITPPQLAPIGVDDLRERRGADGVHVIFLVVPHEKQRLRLVLAWAPPTKAGVPSIVTAIDGDGMWPRAAPVLGARQDKFPQAAVLGALGLGCVQDALCEQE